jgi:hypothetical protein
MKPKPPNYDAGLSATQPRNSVNPCQVAAFVTQHTGWVFMLHLDEMPPSAPIYVYVYIYIYIYIYDMSVAIKPWTVSGKISISAWVLEWL